MSVSVCNERNVDYSVPKDQLYDMFSGTLFETEEKLTRTNMVELLLKARESVFTCTFHKKVTEQDIVELLKTVKSDKELQATKKQLSKQMTEGKLT